MHADNLLAEITAAFPSEPRPGELNIVANNAPGYDWESLQIREAFKNHPWPALPQALMLREQGGFNFLSNVGLQYYLPAYLSLVVRDYAAADSIPDRLVQVLTLPAEIDEVRSALATRLNGLAESMPTVDWVEYHQRRLSELDEWVNYFVDRYRGFTPAQGRAVLHFLQFLRQAHGPDFFNDEPGTAIERYWFQFA